MDYASITKNALFGWYVQNFREEYSGYFLAGFHSAFLKKDYMLQGMDV